MRKDMTAHLREAAVSYFSLQSEEIQRLRRQIHAKVKIFFLVFQYFLQVWTFTTTIRITKTNFAVRFYGWVICNCYGIVYVVCKKRPDGGEKDVQVNNSQFLCRWMRWYWKSPTLWKFNKVFYIRWSWLNYRSFTFIRFNSDYIRQISLTLSF